MADTAPRWSEPGTLADLHLPPAFVTDHAIRSLAYQGAMTASEMARRWRVDDAIAIEVIDVLKSAGLVALESGQQTFERSGRVVLTPAGHERVATARRRTWYAGAIPVALADFEQRLDLTVPRRPTTTPASGLAGLAIAPRVAAEMEQAAYAGATIAVQGAAFDEQRQIAMTLGGSLEGAVSLPFALYAAGAIVRSFDPRYHQGLEAHRNDGSSLDVLRSRETHTQWATVTRPVVALAGGVAPSDALPAYDEDAHFYVAPPPFAACRGLLAVLDADANPQGLAELARLWLLPGRDHTGVLVLRSGERIEIPWRAATVLFGAAPAMLPAALRPAVSYGFDIAQLDAEAGAAFLRMRLADPAVFSAAALDDVAAALQRDGLTTRSAMVSVAAYLRDRAAYEGAAFVLDAATLRAAVDSASNGDSAAAPERLRAAS